MRVSVSHLKGAGADFAAITANTPHIVWDKMKDTFEIPLMIKPGDVSKPILNTTQIHINAIFEMARE